MGLRNLRSDGESKKELKRLLFRIGGATEAQDPTHRPCQCPICSGDIDAEQALRQDVWREHNHAYGCSCDDCEQEIATRRQTFDFSAVRREYDCKIVGIPSDVWTMMDTYHGYLKDTDWSAVKEEPRDLQEIMKIGDRVTSQIEADAMPSSDD